MAQTLRRVLFRDVNLADPFFDSLKAQYEEFSDWFGRKSDEPAYVIYEDGSNDLRGFLYLKIEDGPINDVDPPLPAKRRVKVGTLKVIARGTKLGERLIKRIFDYAMNYSAEEVYVTVFDSHQRLIDLFKRYGFVEFGVKHTPNGDEIVLVRTLHEIGEDIVSMYPQFSAAGRDKWLLAIYPQYHTDLLPDSILRGENPEDEEDVSHTNSIHKVYLGRLTLTRMKPGDLVVVYRTTDRPGFARFRSVATSICVVEETKRRADFGDENEFVAFALDHSVFDEARLRAMYASGDRLYAVRMMYNVSLPRRPIRGQLLDDVGISEQPRWDLRRLSDQQFARIMELGEANENFIVDQA